MNQVKKGESGPDTQHGQRKCCVHATKLAELRVLGASPVMFTAGMQGSLRQHRVYRHNEVTGAFKKL